DRHALFERQSVEGDAELAIDAVESREIEWRLGPNRFCVGDWFCFGDRLCQRCGLLGHGGGRTAVYRKAEQARNCRLIDLQLRGYDRWPFGRIGKSDGAGDVASADCELLRLELDCLVGRDHLQGADD